MKVAGLRDQKSAGLDQDVSSIFTDSLKMEMEVFAIGKAAQRRLSIRTDGK